MNNFSVADIDALASYWHSMGQPIPSEDEARKYLLHIRARLQTDPLLLRYAAYLRTAGDNPRNTQPWQALAEKRLMALWVASEAPIVYGTNQRYAPEDALGLAMTLLGAHTYLWTEDMFQLAYHMPVPKHTITTDALPYPWMYFSYETAHGAWVAGEDNVGKQCNANWVLIKYHPPQSLDVVSDMSPDHYAGPLMVNGGQIITGAIYPDDLLPLAREPTRQILAMLALLNSPYITKEHHPLPREIRRDYVRAKQPVDNELITSVTLRRLVHAPSEEGEETAREYSWRWWVSGHIRAQWYPSLRGHKLIWIAPYIKGPDDKPIKETVYHVKR